MNYWPDMVLNIKSTEFEVVQKLDINNIKNKIQGAA
jgi:hypothetical protein